MGKSREEDLGNVQDLKSELRGWHSSQPQRLPIHPRTECIIPGLVADNRKFRFSLIDYPDPDNSKGGVLIALSVVDLLKSVLPARMANISDETRTVQEGEIIAACTPVTCVD
ncbi:retroviral aspartyl protease family protein [Trichonephila clavipes]|uniref:Retroviral aspartyl protease family protein n=1 Tax=Trichonephila clavipes TaxID=2585209 RepID=A0A8X6VJC8_TRICX|nr:retroviral aspartyl protease family protein [Trichonephila clavipes]